MQADLGAERMRYVFTKEAGARANLEFLAAAYDDFKLNDKLTIEVYLSDGTLRTATNEPEAMKLLNEIKGRYVSRISQWDSASRSVSSDLLERIPQRDSDPTQALREVWSR